MIYYDEKKIKTSLGVKPPFNRANPLQRNEFTEIPKPIGLSQIPTIMVLYDEIRYKNYYVSRPPSKMLSPIQKLYLNSKYRNTEKTEKTEIPKKPKYRKNRNTEKTEIPKYRKTETDGS